MPLNELLLPEYDAEIARTRKMISRLPDDKGDFKPHEKSMSLVKLANHTADMPYFLTLILNREAVDVTSPQERPKPPANCAERLERLDALALDARAKLAEVSDEALHSSFKLVAGPHTVFAGSRYEAVRMLFFSHMIHHRAQLGVYLRLNDCPVPSIYGPSADEAV